LPAVVKKERKRSGEKERKERRKEVESMSNYYGVSDSLRIVSFATYDTILLSGCLLLMAFCAECGECV